MSNPLASLAHDVAVPALEDLDGRPHVLEADGALEVLLEGRGQVWGGAGAEAVGRLLVLICQVVAALT